MIFLKMNMYAVAITPDGRFAFFKSERGSRSGNLIVDVANSRRRKAGYRNKPSCKINGSTVGKN